MAFKILSIALAVLVSIVQAVDERAVTNPIRKVVTMLQMMQTKVEEEGEKEKALFDKFMCYCKTSGGDLSASISAAESSISEFGSKIKESEEQKAQLEDELKQAQSDRAAAKATIAEATALREKEAAAFAAEKEESDANIEAITKAVAALEKGMGGSFLQTNAAKLLKKLALSRHDTLIDEDQDELLSFLSSTQDSQYAPQSGQITGILKQMGDEMRKSLAEATAAEEAAIKSYGELMAAKEQEVIVLTKAIETKMDRIGSLGVEIAQMKNDLGDTEEALIADKEFIANLDKACATKAAEWDEIVKTRAEELAALADTIKILNDDDALDLFKKTLPSAAASLMQVKVSATALRTHALAQLQKLTNPNRPGNARLNLIMLALKGKKIGFEKVIKMIDDLVATLKTEQNDDEDKKEYCSAQFDASDDKKKELEKAVSDLETSIANAKEDAAKLTEEIASLEAGMKELDKTVLEATEQRKEENEDFKELMASDTAAKELLNFAKNRLNKFYNPKLYQPPPKTELSKEDRIVENMSGTAAPTAAPGGIAGTGITVLAQVSAHTQKAAPPPPPETFGPYTKKSEENSGVIAMIDLLIKDLDKEMTEAETSEKDAQTDYETLMADSAAKRTADSKSLTEKESIKADLEADLETHEEGKASTSNELMSTLQYIQSLHAECDWLIKYFDVRREARSSEIDALGKAKAVLSSADYSLLQMRARGSLRGSP